MSETFSDPGPKHDQDNQSNPEQLSPEERHQQAQEAYVQSKAELSRALGVDGEKWVDLAKQVGPEWRGDDASIDEDKHSVFTDVLLKRRDLAEAFQELPATTRNSLIPELTINKGSGGEFVITTDVLSAIAEGRIAKQFLDSQRPTTIDALRTIDRETVGEAWGKLALADYYRDALRATVLYHTREQAHDIKATFDLAKRLEELGDMEGVGAVRYMIGSDLHDDTIMYRLVVDPRQKDLSILDNMLVPTMSFCATNGNTLHDGMWLDPAPANTEPVAA